MIIKGRAVGSIGHWSRYLKDVGDNEKVIEHEIRGTWANDLKGALEEMRDFSLATRSEGDFLYHGIFTIHPEDKLTTEQWLQSIERVEQRMGFNGHQRVIYEHVKEDGSHFHVLWSRVDLKSLTIKDIQGDRYTLRRVANEFEQEYGLRPTKAVRDFDDARYLAEWEYKAAERSGVNIKAFKAELLELWHATDSGKAFIAAADERGYAIAKGDQRSFVILDRGGEIHSLPRRLDGVRTADVCARFDGIDLPSVAEARDVQRARAMEQGRTAGRDGADRASQEFIPNAPIVHANGNRPLKDREPKANQQIDHKRQLKTELTGIWRETDSAKAFMAAIEERGYAIAKGDRRGFVILDRNGEVHSLPRRLDGVATADVRARFADVELPTLTQARAWQNARAMEEGGNFDRDSARGAWEDSVHKAAVAYDKKVQSDQRRAEFIAKLRSEAPFTKVEERISEAFERTAANPDDFAKTLRYNYVMLARVTPADIEKLEKERTPDLAPGEDARVLAGISRTPKENELVAVTSRGRVHRLNEHKLDLNAIADRYVNSTGSPLPSVADTRAIWKDRRYERQMAWERQRLAARDRGHADMVSEQRAANWRFERNSSRPDPNRGEEGRERSPGIFTRKKLRHRSYGPNPIVPKDRAGRLEVMREILQSQTRDQKDLRPKPRSATKA